MSSPPPVPLSPIISSRPKYPIGIPSKFSPEGVLQRYPGNTTLCHLPSTCPLLPTLRAIYTSLENHPTLSKKIHLLPQSSWHMTIFDGVQEEIFSPAEKSKQLLSENTAQFANQLRNLNSQLEKEGLSPPYHMHVRGFDECIVGIGLEIEGATIEEEKRMRRLRDRLSDALGFRATNHENYGFHISMAYLLRYIDGEDRQELNRVLEQHLPEIRRNFELGAVEFCTFEDMYAYERLFYLGEKEDERVGICG